MNFVLHMRSGRGCSLGIFPGEGSGMDDTVGESVGRGVIR